MTHIKYLIGTCILLLALYGCNDDPDYVIGSDSSRFALYPVAIPVNADGGIYELKITGNEIWTIELSENNSSSSDWFTLSETSGSGAKTVTLTVEPSNSFVKLRSVIVNVRSETRILRSKVIQETMVLGEDEVLINGMIWSTKNIGAPGTFASSPDDPGMYYQFNRKIGYPSGPQGDPTPAGWPASYTNEETNWLPENDPSPEGWRVPTAAEMVALWEIGATWVSSAQTGFKVDGLIIGIPESTAKTANKNNLKQLGGVFLPQSGWRDATGAVDRGWLCAVRTGTSLSPTHGGMSLGDSGGYRDVWGWGDGHKVRAAMIRPVKNIQVEN